MKTNKVQFMTQAAMIAAIYVVLCVVFQPISYGPIQTRIAEALTVLPFFTPAAIPGLFVGCLIANVLGGGIILDVIAGSVATLIAAFATYALRNKSKYLDEQPHRPKRPRLKRIREDNFFLSQFSYHCEPRRFINQSFIFFVRDAKIYYFIEKRAGSRGGPTLLIIYFK